MRTILLLPLLALGACQTETRERNLTGMWTDGSEASRRPESRPPEPEKPREPPKGTVISIPPEVAAQHANFTDRESTIFGDVVEIDASRNGWFSMASMSVAKDAVRRTNVEDAQRGVLTITLERLPQSPPTPDAVPTVRFGNGLRVVGVDRVVLRFWSQQSAERPLWFQARGAGKKAVFQVDGPPEEKRSGRQISVRAEIVRIGDTYRFDTSAEAQP